MELVPSRLPSPKKKKVQKRNKEPEPEEPVNSK
jgi:hypothetical protein